MAQKSKLILEQTGIKVFMPGSGKHYSTSEKRQIIADYLSSGCSKCAIWEKHTGQPKEHGQLLRWMRALGYDSLAVVRSTNFAASNKTRMQKTTKHQSRTEEAFEILQLKKRISELEIKLKEAEMKAIAFSTMVDIAEEEFKIPIRKKYNTKPSK
jgi:transposase-like protein